MRAVAERSVQQAKVAFQQLVHAAQEAVSLEERGDTSQVGALDTSKKAMTSAERNVLSAFRDLEKSIAMIRIKTPLLRRAGFYF